MNVEEVGYELYTGAVLRQVPLPRAEARKLYRQCMETKGARIAVLKELMRTDGVSLASSDAAIQDLSDWFFNGVEPDPETPGSLSPLWHSIAHDVALFLGDEMIERHPNLRWEFFTWGKSNVAFQRPVIMGLSTEDPKFHTNIDIDFMVSAYGRRIVQSRGSISTYGTVTVRGVDIDVDASARRFRGQGIEPDIFRRWLEGADERA